MAMRTAMAALLLVVAGWTSCTSSTTERPVPAAALPKQQPAESAKVNLDEIFPAGRGRQLVLNNCTTCHTFVPIVILKMTKEAWERNSRDHRGRVAALGEADFKVLYEYLATNFGPDKPVPKLPNALLDTWTSY